MISTTSRGLYKIRSIERVIRRTFDCSRFDLVAKNCEGKECERSEMLSTAKELRSVKDSPQQERGAQARTGRLQREATAFSSTAAFARSFAPLSKSVLVTGNITATAPTPGARKKIGEGDVKCVELQVGPQYDVVGCGLSIGRAQIWGYITHQGHHH